MEVRCEFYTRDEKYWFSKAYICEVTKVPKEMSSFRVEKFVGTHEFGKSDDDVKCLIISGHKLKIFPKNLHQKFPDLRFLKIKGCGIEKITQEELIGLDNLECLNLSGNRLTSVPDDLFVGMKNLRWISFYDNKIEQLSSRLFDPIKSTLVFADFKYNSKISEKFDRDEAKHDFPKLMRLIDINCLQPEPSSKSRPVNSATEICTSNQHMKLLNELANLRTSRQFTDFTITFRGKEFKIHKCILAAQSSVFKQMFTSDRVEALTKIKNISETAFESFLNYFYSGESGTDAVAAEMLELAAVFDIPELKSASTCKILSSLNECNALQAFELGHQYRSDDLKHGAFKIIRKLFPDLDPSFVDRKEEVRRLMSARNEIDEIMKK